MRTTPTTTTASFLAQTLPTCGVGRLVECGNNSSDEGQTTDGEVESDKEDVGDGGGGGGGWWGGLDENEKNNATAAGVGVQGAIGATLEEREAGRKQRKGLKKKSGKSRRSVSSSPMKLRVGGCEED